MKSCIEIPIPSTEAYDYVLMISGLRHSPNRHDAGRGRANSFLLLFRTSRKAFIMSQNRRKASKRSKRIFSGDSSNRSAAALSESFIPLSLSLSFFLSFQPKPLLCLYSSKPRNTMNYPVQFRQPSPPAVAYAGDHFSDSDDEQLAGGAQKVCIQVPSIVFELLGCCFVPVPVPDSFFYASPVFPSSPSVSLIELLGGTSINLPLLLLL